jgi:hypothetical protein
VTNGPVVYFAAAEGLPGYVKIGWARDVGKRLAEFQTGNPFRLKLLATLYGGRDVEVHYHHEFASYRVRPDGEWFHLTGALAEFVRRLRTGGHV